MYKLLLVTRDAQIRESFSGIQDLHRQMFEPITILDNAKDAAAMLKKGGTDAVGFALDEPEQRLLMEQILKDHPSIPIFSPRRRGEELRAELALTREYLDQLHADYSDYENDADMTLARLRNELVHKLLEEKILSREELKSRLLLSRSPLSDGSPCFLFEFDLPDGPQYLQSRWHHGFERLDLALHANFFGRIQGPLYCGSALLSGQTLRVIACAAGKLSEREVDLFSQRVQEQVLSTAHQIKDYMDLELVCTSFRVTDSLSALIPPTGS